MSKYNVFVVKPENLEDTIDALNEISSRDPNFNPLLKPYQYLIKEHKSYLNTNYLNNKASILRFDTLKEELQVNHPSKKVNNQVLSAYLKHKGFHSFKVKLCEANSYLTLWKHTDNTLC